MNNIGTPIMGRNTVSSVEYADIVIVGNGIAGLTAAIEARHLAPDLSIVMITDQCHPTIHTPALKQFTIGKVAQEQLLAYPPGTERLHRIHVVNTRVEGINAQGKYLHLPGGYGFGYGSLLLATGSKANGLPADFPGRDFDGVLTLHRLQDYLNLRRRLPEVESAVVIGGGAHAIETAMALLFHGIEVHWLIRGTSFLSKVLDHPASELVLAHTRHAGAKIYTQTHAIGVVGRLGSAIGVVTNQHEMIPCQMVLVCTGTSPDTTLANHCSIPMQQQQGIIVDGQLRTSVRDIYAVGDVAALKNPQTGVYETHAQWYAAVQQGRIVATSMTGHYDRVLHALGVSWHATHVGELYMLTVGTPLAPLKGATTLTDHGKKRYRRMSIIGDRLVGYLSLGTVQPDSLAIKRIIDEGLPIGSVKKALLKGNFDARKFFSQKKSRIVQEMVTSSKLPAIVPESVFVPALAVPSLPAMRAVPRPISPQDARRDNVNPPALPVIQAAPFPLTSQNTGSNSFRPSTLSEQPTLHQPELFALPSVTQNVQREPQTEPHRNTRPLFASIYHQATIHVCEESLHQKADISALTTSDKKVIESMLVPLPARPITHTLWSYSEKLPVPQQEKPVNPGSDKMNEAKIEQRNSINFLL